MRSNHTGGVIGSEPAADPLGGFEEKQMDDALRGIKSAHGFDRLTKSADGEFWEVSAKKGDKKKTLEKSNVKKRSQSDLFSCEPKPTDFGCGCFEGKEQDEQAANPEVEAKAQEGFAELRSKAAKYDGDGASLEDADKIARDVKAKHPVFKKLHVVDGEEDWDFEATYNPTVKKDGPDKEKAKDGKNNGQLLTNNSVSAQEDLNFTSRDESKSDILGHDATTKSGTKGIVVGSAGTESKYVKKIKEANAEGTEFGTLNPLAVSARKSHISKQEIHKNYKVTQEDLSFEGTNGGQLVVNYGYTVEQEGQAPERREFSVTIIPNEIGGTTIASATNVGIKDPGTRGHTQSANNSNIANDLANDAGVENTEIDVVFNASHLIADWLNGSGYSSSLNLINTSDTYNQVTMANIEKNVVDAAKSKEQSLINSNGVGEYMTFNIEVTANWEKIGDSKIIDVLKGKLTEANGIEDQAEKDKVLVSLVAKLSALNDPQFITSTDYYAYNGVLKDAAGIPTGNTEDDIFEGEIGEDVDLKNLIAKIYG